MATPYRSADVRPESTPVRMSWWSFATTLVLVLMAGTLAYLVFRYVAQGWIGYGVGGLIALFALATLREVPAGKLADCPRCGALVELGLQREGYLCRSCTTFLEVDRGRMLASRDDQIANRAVFGVWSVEQLPDRCCICLAPTVRRDKTQIGTSVLDVPYCAEHSRGVGANRFHVYFRSLAYAKLASELNHEELLGTGKQEERESSRWLGASLGLVMAGGAAATYWGLAALDESNYAIVPASPKGLVMWILIKLLGRLWITTILAVLAAGFFSLFIGSFKPKPRAVSR
jgi:hypothetical protein